MGRAESVDSLLNGFRFDLDQSYKLSLELSQLAEKFVSVGSGWKYTNRVGNLPTSAAAPKFHSNTEAKMKDFAHFVVIPHPPPPHAPAAV